MTYFQEKQEAHKHRYFIDAETGEELCLCGKLKGKAAPKKNKFNATKSNYEGYIYDSGKEASYAQELDLMKKAGKIKAWDRQFIVEVEPEGKPFFKTKVDFRVHNFDGSFQLHEVKSWITARDRTYRLKLKAIELFWLPKHPEYEYKVIQ